MKPVEPSRAWGVLQGGLYRREGGRGKMVAGVPRGGGESESVTALLSEGSQRQDSTPSSCERSSEKQVKSCWPASMDRKASASLSKQ